MKKLYFSFFLILSLLIIFGIFVKKVYSEELTFDRAYQDYQYNTDRYNKLHADYVLARASYLQYGTLLSKNNAQAATLAMLMGRDDIEIAYLTALRARLKEVGGVSDDKRQELFSLIDSEVSWFMNHKQTLNSSMSLNDLVLASDQVKDHNPAFEVLVYKVLTTISFGKIEAIRMEEASILDGLKNKITEIKANGDKDTLFAQRGISEVENKLAASQTKDSEALDIIGKVKPEDIDRSGRYSDALDAIGQSFQALREAGAFLSQIITNIETKD